MSEDAAGTDESDDGPEADAEDETATDAGAAGPTSVATEVADDVVDRANDLADRVADHDDDLAAAVEALAEDLQTLRDEVDALRETADRAEELESSLKRKQAEFENYKKRQEREREKLRERATEAFVEQVVEVRDDLVRALAQDEDADLREGLEGTLATFDDVLDEEGVDPIEPDPGDEIDPVRHEVLMREESDRPEGTVVQTFRPGYEMAGHVVQTAQVTVSEGPAPEEESDTGAGTGTEAETETENPSETGG